jgi:hypothetical protein
MNANHSILAPIAGRVEHDCTPFAALERKNLALEPVFELSQNETWSVPIIILPAGHQDPGWQIRHRVSISMPQTCYASSIEDSVRDSWFE